MPTLAEMREAMNKIIFRFKTGRWPRQDDLDRVNCIHAGRLGHMSCGWCAKHRAPMWQCCCRSVETFSALVKDETAMPFRGPAKHGK